MKMSNFPNKFDQTLDTRTHTADQVTLYHICSGAIEQAKACKKASDLPPGRFTVLAMAANYFSRNDIDVQTIKSGDLCAHLCRSTVTSNFLHRKLWPVIAKANAERDTNRRAIFTSLFSQYPEFDAEAVMEGRGQSEAFLEAAAHELTILGSLTLSVGTPWAYLRDNVEDLQRVMAIYQDFNEDWKMITGIAPMSQVRDPLAAEAGPAGALDMNPEEYDRIHHAMIEPHRGAPEEDFPENLM